MLKKKIILGGLIMSTLIVGYTQAAIFTPNETITNRNVQISCDEYFNCTSTFNDQTYSGLFVGTNNNKQFMGMTFWNNNELGYVFGYFANNALSQKVYSGNLITTTYTGIDTYTQTSCDYLPSKGNIPIETFISDYIGKPISKYMINGTMNGGCVCAGYQDTQNSICYYVGGYSTDRPEKSRGIASGPMSAEKMAGIETTLSPLTAGGPDTEGGPISCINIKTQIMLYGNKYNTGMCYTNGLYFSGFTPIQTGKLSIFEVFPSYEDYQNMTNRYNTYCHPPYTQEYCAEAMSGYDQGMDFFTTIENANNNSVFTVEADRLYQYCHLQLNFTEEEKRAECEETIDNFYATGVNENSLPNPFEGLNDYILNEINFGVPTPTTGSVLDELLTTDDQGKIKIELLKRVQQFKEIYSKMTTLFKYRNTQQGVIPGYITSLLMIIVLLALFKK